MRLFLAFSLALVLPACVGGTFGDTSEYEMFPLRGATKEEGRGLKRCLRAAYAAQEKARKRTGHLVRKIKDLPIEWDCGDLHVTQHRTPSGYEILAELHKHESAVRWSVNEKGVIEEHLDSEGDAELEF